MNNKNSICGSNQKIGKNVAANYPRLVALKLGLPNPETFTSHALKRTGITFLADAGKITFLKYFDYFLLIFAGLNAVQIMAHTKHRSASVLQGYVDNSMQQKTNVSKCLSVATENAADFDKKRQSEAPQQSVKQLKIDSSPDSVTQGSGLDVLI